MLEGGRRKRARAGDSSDSYEYRFGPMFELVFELSLTCETVKILSSAYEQFALGTIANGKTPLICCTALQGSNYTSLLGTSSLAA